MRQCACLRQAARALSTKSAFPSSDFPILDSVQAVRAWRRQAFAKNETVGFVPTMGALHDGHLSLAKMSLEQCNHTVVSIFVNPAQFAPHEDLAAYPRTLETDLQKLASLKSSDGSKSLSALFLPPVKALYPEGIEQDVAKQKGTFIEVKGYSAEMEGKSRPTFFRGVATVVCKLFNIVQPDKAFFGQKDVQQCVIVRQMAKDLHLAHPSSPSNIVIHPTCRETDTNLALSSRNAYLTAQEKPYAPTLYKALKAAEVALHQYPVDIVPALHIVDAAEAVIRHASKTAEAEGLTVRMDYITLNDPQSLAPLLEVNKKDGAILSGAMWVGKTRLIDNLLLNYRFS